MGEREAYGQAMREGHVHAWAGRWREATAFYRRALESLPGDTTARSSLAASLANSGAPGEALDLVEALAVDRPEDSAIALRLADLRQRSGRMDLADAAYLRVAELYRAAGQNDKASAIWRRLVGLSGHRPATMASVAAAAREAGATEVAEQADALSAAIAPVVATPVAAIAPTAEGAPDGIAALAAALRSRGLAPRPSVGPAAPTGPDGRAIGAPDGHPAVADVGQEEGAHRSTWTGLDDALTALAASPDEPGGVRAVALALARRGQVALARRQLAGALDVVELDGDISLAVALTSDLIALGEEPTSLWRRRVRVALADGHADVAADGYLALADELARRGESASAVAELRRARAVAPLNASVQAQAGHLLSRLGAGFEADDARRRAFQLDPHSPSHAVDYAVASAHRGAVEELEIALQALEALRQAATSGPAAGTARASVSAELRETVQAALDEDLSGTSPVTRWCRGRLLRLLGAPEAEAELRAAAAGPAPIGPLAAVELAEVALAEDRAALALDVLRPWLAGGVDLQPDRIAGLALSAADRVGDAPTAIAALRVLTSLAPDDGATGGLLAERLAAGGRAAEAAAELARLADLESGRGNVEAAAAMYQAAIGLDRSDPAIVLRAAELSRRQGRREEARRLYLQLADDHPGQRTTALLAAAELSSPGQRVDLLRGASEASPADPEPRQRLIQALVASGQAVQAAAEAAALAEMLQHAGDRAGALAAIDQARRLDPWNSGLQALRDSLGAGQEGA